MRNVLLSGLVSMLLVGSLLSQSGQPEPFSFKDDKLGMSLEDFKARHHKPGQWENKATLSMQSGDQPSPGKGWEWVSNTECKEIVKAVTECHYMDTITDISARAWAIFADDKLAAINLWYSDAPAVLVAGSWIPAGDRTWQVLVAKLGPPQITRIVSPGYPPGSTRRTLRWDNGVSEIEFQNDPCNSAAYYEGIEEILRGRYCESPNTTSDSISIWYVHKTLSNLLFERRKEAADSADKKARSDL